MRYLPLLLLILISCSRKLHTERTTTHESDTRTVNIDSLNEVIRTYKDAYESLFNSQSGTEVTVKPPPGMPHVLSEVTVHPDGSKTIKGGTIVYRDSKSTLEKLSRIREQVIDSMSRLVRVDTSHHEASSVVVVRSVKTTVIPWWFWLALIIAGLLWLNERFGFVRVPLLTKK